MRCFWLLWSLLAWVSAVLCTAGCLFPYWLSGAFKVTLWNPNATTKVVTSQVGLFRRCVYPIYTSGLQIKDAHPDPSSIALQPNCGHYVFADIPHMAWKMGLVALSVASIVLFFITFFLFVSGFNIAILANKRVCRFSQLGFLVSGILAGITCILFPVGWRSNEETRQICGPSSDAFNIGHCEIGWAYVVTIAGSLTALFSSLLPCLMGPSEGDSHRLNPSHRLAKFNHRDGSNRVYLSGTNLPLLLTQKSTATPTDQASLNQGSFSRKTSSLQGLVAVPQGSYVAAATTTPEFRLLMPTTGMAPVIVQTQ